MKPSLFSESENPKGQVFRDLRTAPDIQWVREGAGRLVWLANTAHAF